MFSRTEAETLAEAQRILAEAAQVTRNEGTRGALDNHEAFWHGGAAFAFGAAADAVRNALSSASAYLDDEHAAAVLAREDTDA